MPHIKHLTTVLLALLMCSSVSAQKADALSDQISVDITEHIEVTAFIAEKQQYLDSLSTVFSGRNLHIYNEGLLRSTTAYTASDTAGLSMRTSRSSMQGNTMQTAVNIGTFSSGIDYVAVVPLSGFSDSYGSSWPDFFFRFTLAEPMSVTLSHEASEIDTHMSLLDTNGTCMAYNDDYDGESHCTDTRHAFIQRSLPAGTYYVVSEGEYENAMICLSIYGNTSGSYGYSSIPSTYSTYSTSSRVLGTMGTQSGVTAMGGASCSVPIKVPQGVGGLAPSLSITYNSQSGNGLAGYGAGLTGLSSITRGPKDIYHDGDARGITYTSDDALYLDGVRLVLESGTPGQDGAVYTPESDPFSKVIAHGTCTNTSNSTWYEVRSSDGMVYHYGNSQDSRLSYTDSHGAQKIHSWYLSHVQQPSGNYMSYYYHTYSHCVYPYMISYGTNINQTSTLANIVEFTYESRNDTVPIRFDGLSGSMDRRLKGISCSTNGSIYRTYTLTYNSTSDGSAYKFSRLTGVTETNGSNQSLPATSLRWSYLPSVSYSANDLTVNLPTNLPAGTSCGFSDFEYMSGDLNGDGLSDIVGIGTVGEEKVVEIFYASIINGELVYSTSNIRGDYYTTLNSGTFINNIGSTYNMERSIVDIDGDGINELLLYHYDHVEQDYGYIYIDVYGERSGSNRIRKKLNRPFEPIITTGDLYNNGKPVILVLETSQFIGNKYPLHRFRNVNDINNNSPILACCDTIGLSFSSTPRRIYLSDLNGNGKTDLLVICDNGYKIYWGGEGMSFSEELSYTGTGLQHRKTLVPGDFNGDGLLDFLTVSSDSSSLNLFINQGNGSFSQPIPIIVNDSYFYDNITQDDNLIITNSKQDSYDCTPFDFDYDGRTDLIITKTFGSAYYYPLMGELVPVFPSNAENGYTITKWLRSDGMGFSEVLSSKSSGKDEQISLMIGDFNNDGISDVAGYGKNRIANQNVTDVTPTWRLYLNGSLTPQSGKVISVTGDMGMTTSFTYASLTDSSVYTRGPQHSYPAPSYTLPISVVRSMRQDYGTTSSVYTTEYSYGGLRLHLQGRGLLGLSSMTERNTTTGITTESGVSHWNSTYYVPDLTYTRTTISDLASDQTSESTTTLSLAGKNVNDRKRYFVYRSSTVETDMDGMRVTTSRTCDTQDGYLLEDSTIYSPGMYNVVSYSDHVLAGGAYRPRNIQTTRKHADDAQPFSTTAAYEYDIASGAVTQRTDNSQSTKPLTTTYTYDVWGNLTSQVSTGSGIGTPLTTYYVYDETHRFPVREYTSPSSSVKLYTYNLWGDVLTERDSVNSSVDHTTQHSYDSWGNLTRTQIPGSGEVSYTRGWGSDASRLYYILEQGTSSPWTKTWYDSQGREVLTESVGPMDIRLSTTTEYNLRSEVVRTTSVQGDLSTTVSYGYDPRGRLISKNAPGESVVRYSYSSTQDGRSVTVDDNSRITTTTYDAMGNVRRVEGPNSSLTNTYRSCGGLRTTVTEGSTWTFTYDDRGERISITDPDAGTTTYTYDALGREIRRVDGRGVAYVTSYDYLGRVTQKKAGSETIRYTYWTAGPGQLLLKSESYDGWTRNYAYDDLGHVTEESMTRTGETTRTRTYQYGPSGLLAERTLPGGMSQEYSYDTYGNLTGTDFGSGTIAWSLSSYSGRRTVAQTRLNGYTSQPFLSTRLLDSYGYLDSLIIKRNGSYYQQEDYGFSTQTGNLMSRNNLSFDNQETFTYDSADRLTDVSQHGQTILSMSYSPNGNINTRTGMGTYTYGSSSRPHAVTAVDNTSGEIDYNSQDISYNSWNRVSSVWQYYDDDCYGYSIEYGPDLRRVRSQLHTYNHLIYDMFYWDDYEEKTVGTDTYRYYYIYASGELDALHVVKSGPGGVSTHTTKVITDHLGSITGLADNYYMAYFAGFDVWGGREVYIPYWFDGTFNRGYTGHEHIDELGLINMTGRMYDPRLGRFLSPDPFVQAPTDPQNYNRYSYCLNNPLKYTDPSGEIIWGALLIGATLGAYSGYQIGEAKGGKKMLGYILGGAAIGGISGILGASAASSGFMANTISTMVGSSASSLGMSALSGGSVAPNISFGAVSFDFGSKQLNTFNKVNSTLQNIGYGMGTLSFLSDILAGKNPGSVELRTENDPIYYDQLYTNADEIINDGFYIKDYVGHSQLNIDGIPVVDWGPANPPLSDIFDWVEGSNSFEKGMLLPAEKMKWSPVDIKGVNTNRLLSWSPTGKYNLFFNSCVSQASRALNASGIPNIGIHPYLLHMQMYLRSIGVRPLLQSYYLTY